MFREIPENEFQPFFLLMAEIECGSHFDSDNPTHVNWLNDKIHKHYAAGSKFYAFYTDDNIPLGIAGINIETSLHSEWTSGELVDIGIFPEYRGQGFGSELLGFIEQLAREARCYCLYMQTYAAEHRTIAFYGKNGYVPVATIPNTNGPGDEGTIWMRKILSRNTC